MFIASLDGERQWYRYHHLFAAYLERRLTDQVPGDVPVLHRRASDWFAAQGLVDEAFAHALAAGDTGRAGEILDDDGKLAILPTAARAVHEIEALPKNYADAIAEAGGAEGVPGARRVLRSIAFDLRTQLAAAFRELPLEVAAGVRESATAN